MTQKNRVSTYKTIAIAAAIGFGALGADAQTRTVHPTVGGSTGFIRQTTTPVQVNIPAPSRTVHPTTPPQQVYIGQQPQRPIQWHHPVERRPEQFQGNGFIRRDNFGGVRPSWHGSDWYAFAGVSILCDSLSAFNGYYQQYYPPQVIETVPAQQGVIYLNGQTGPQSVIGTSGLSQPASATSSGQPITIIINNGTSQGSAQSTDANSVGDTRPRQAWSVNPKTFFAGEYVYWPGHGQTAADAEQFMTYSAFKERDSEIVNSGAGASSSGGNASGSQTSAVGSLFQHYLDWTKNIVFIGVLGGITIWQARKRFAANKAQKVRNAAIDEFLRRQTPPISANPPGAQSVS